MDWLAALCGLPKKFKFARAVRDGEGAVRDGEGAVRDGDGAVRDGAGAGNGNGNGARAAAGMEGATADAAAAARGGGGGVIQGTSSEAVLVALLAARARAMRGRDAGDARRLVAYCSDQTHSCFKKVEGRFGGVLGGFGTGLGGVLEGGGRFGGGSDRDRHTGPHPCETKRPSPPTPRRTSHRAAKPVTPPL